MDKEQAARRLGISVRTLQRWMAAHRIGYREVQGKFGPEAVFDQEEVECLREAIKAQHLTPAVKPAIAGMRVASEASAPASWKAPAADPQELIEIIAARDGMECRFCGKSLDHRARRLSPDHWMPHLNGPHRLDEMRLVCGACQQAREARGEVEFRAWLASRAPLVLAAESRRALVHLAEENRLADLAYRLTLTLREATEIAGLSKGYLLAAVKAGELKASKRGRGWNIKRADLEAWVRKL